MEHFYTAYVTVKLAVGLAFDKKPTKKQLRRAAIENFMDHPALKSRSDLDELGVERVEFEEEK